MFPNPNNRIAKKGIVNFLKSIEKLALIGDTGEDYILTFARCLNLTTP